jgi:hypothetical protein
MCAVSAITDYGMRMPNEWWDYQKALEYKRLIRQAEEFDRKTNQPDCVDPAKDEFMKKILERLEAIEKKLDQPVGFYPAVPFPEVRTGDIVEISPTFIGPRIY